MQPNQAVHKGDLLVRFDDTTLKAQADVAERALNVAEAEYRASAQRAFQDTDSKARLDFLAAQVAQKRAERDYANALLSRSEIHAERDGIAVFADAERWVGKPVRTGERLMDLADPASVSLRIELDVGDAIRLKPDAPITLFLDSDPLTPHGALLDRIAYESEQTPAGNLAYRHWTPVSPESRRALVYAVRLKYPVNMCRWRCICSGVRLPYYASRLDYDKRGNEPHPAALRRDLQLVESAKGLDGAPQWCWQIRSPGVTSR